LKQFKTKEVIIFERQNAKIKVQRSTLFG